MAGISRDNNGTRRILSVAPDGRRRMFDEYDARFFEGQVRAAPGSDPPRFHSISRRLFGHTENRHKLIAPRQRAIVKFAARPGMKVRFRIDDKEHIGIVNRIAKRATVLVEDPKGSRYANGKHDRAY
jgi:hypothetical protein